MKLSRLICDNPYTVICIKALERISSLPPASGVSYQAKNTGSIQVSCTQGLTQNKSLLNCVHCKTIFISIKALWSSCLTTEIPQSSHWTHGFPTKLLPSLKEPLGTTKTFCKPPSPAYNANHSCWGKPVFHASEPGPSAQISPLLLLLLLPHRETCTGLLYFFSQELCISEFSAHSKRASLLCSLTLLMSTLPLHVWLLPSGTTWMELNVVKNQPPSPLWTFQAHRHWNHKNYASQDFRLRNVD